MARKKNLKKFIAAVMVFGGAFGIVKIVKEIRGEKRRSMQSESGGMEIFGKETMYAKICKPLLDSILSFAGLIILSPLFMILSVAVFIDDPGAILFTQERIGRGKEYFRLHKFRSMKMSTPHDVPTHQLSDPEQYITRVGKFLRKYSLDELPQIWDIFVGNMSIIGPRPALWNQDDLVAERDKYGANDIKPGLTGWAQINGRDELEITEKAKLDGEYVEQLRQGGVKALFFDVKCFLGTVRSVLHSEGVVEGGTGEMKREEKGALSREAGKKVKGESYVIPKNPCVEEAGRRMKDSGMTDEADAGFTDYGHRKHFQIDTSEKNKKRVLVTGAGSYIGESFEEWAKEHYSVNFTIDTLDMQTPFWREKDFSLYDVVFHVAGIAHADVGKATEEEKKRYYDVNTRLAIETAEKAKREGVEQFVFMSSMIIYGESAPCGKKKVVDEYTLPAPANFYGDSKWQADKGVRALADERFHVAVLRPPMIYGRGSKGNYPVLAKLAEKLPVFPDVENQRSMLYIGNLCEFLCKLMLSGEGGVYFPQNEEYTKTSEMVKEIAKSAGKRIWITKLLVPVVKIGSHIPGKVPRLVNKAFGDSIYSQKLSIYSGLDYQVISLKDSVKMGEEGADAAQNFSCNVHGYSGSSTEGCRGSFHILVVSQYFYPETFRINDIASEWVKRGYKVTVLTGIPNYPMGKFFDGYGYRSRRREQRNGVDIIRIPLIPRGNSGNRFFNSLGMAANYLSFVLSGWWWKATTDIRADLVFTFEVSPMTQALVGVWYAKKYCIPHFLYVQDLWPENVETVVGVKNRVVITPINRMVDYIYKHTDQIFTTSQSFVDAIVNREVGVEKEKVHYWPQYAEEFYKPLDGKEVRKAAEEGSPVRLIPDDESFKIVFTGNIGTAQGLDILPKAAEKLKDFQIEKKIRFVIVGDGRYQEAFKKEIRRRNVTESFIMIPRQKPEEIPKLLACCDEAFMSFSDEGLWEKTIPAKLQTYMACGMPVIAAAKGETEQVIREAECGICVPIGNVEELVNGIKELMNLPLREREKLGRNAREYCQKYFHKQILMDRIEIFLSLYLRFGDMHAEFAGITENR